MAVARYQRASRSVREASGVSKAAKCQESLTDGSFGARHVSGTCLTLFIREIITQLHRSWQLAGQLPDSSQKSAGQWVSCRRSRQMAPGEVPIDRHGSASAKTVFGLKQKRSGTTPEPRANKRPPQLSTTGALRQASLTGSAFVDQAAKAFFQFAVECVNH